MTERLLIAALLLLVGGALFCLQRRRQLRRAAQTAPTDPILRHLKPGVPAIVYFTTPHCLPCRTQQQPTLQHLAAELGEERLQIVKVDASVDVEAAARWGVMTAPTLFILDKSGRPRHVYYGVTAADELKRRLRLVQDA